MCEAKVATSREGRWAKPWQRLTTHVGAYQLPPQLPEAYRADSHLVVVGDNLVSQAVQAAELLPRVVDAKYPGPGRGVNPSTISRNVTNCPAMNGGS